MSTRSGTLIREGGSGRATVLCLAHLKSGAFEAEGDHLAYRPFVFDD